jgi:hypothetical protein
MIAWPDEAHVTGEAEKALGLFKKSSLAAELEDDKQKWRFRSFARSTAAQGRMVLRSEAGETRIFALEPTGYWVRVVEQDVRSPS